MRHFEAKFFDGNSQLNTLAIPTLNLPSSKGITTTLIDYEELLTQNIPNKKKRGSSGKLINYYGAILI